MFLKRTLIFDVSGLDDEGTSTSSLIDHPENNQYTIFTEPRQFILSMSMTGSKLISFFLLCPEFIVVGSESAMVLD